MDCGVEEGGLKVGEKALAPPAHDPKAWVCIVSGIDEGCGDEACCVSGCVLGLKGKDA